MKRFGRVRLVAGVFLIVALGVLAVVFVSGRGDLPPGRVLVGESEEVLRAMVLSNAPIGTARGDVERVLAKRFRREWRVVDYESRELVQKRGFSVPVAGGDHYIESTLAVVSRNWWSSDVVTVYFLFGRSGELKDVAVKKWMDSI